MDVDHPRQLSTEALGVLREGIGLVFSQWWTLQTPIQNKLGGPDPFREADQLASDAVSWFTPPREPLYIDELEKMLHKVLKSLNTLAEDGSVEEVAEKLMIMHVDRPRQLSMEALGVLREYIGLVFSEWQVLQMAIQNPSRQADQLASNIVSWFTQSREPLYVDDLENILHQVLECLNTLAEDGSVEEVAEKLMIMREECLEGNFESIENLRKVSSHHVRQVLNDDDDDVGGDDGNDNGDPSDVMPEDSSNMMVDAPEWGVKFRYASQWPQTQGGN